MRDELEKDDFLLGEEEVEKADEEDLEDEDEDEVADPPTEEEEV